STTTINTIPTPRRCGPTPCRRPRSSKSCSPATWRSCLRKRSLLAPTGEMAGDQLVHLGGMGERAHMASALEHGHGGIRQRGAQQVDNGAGGRSRLVADDQQRRRGDARVVAQARTCLDDDHELERDFVDGGGNGLLEFLW